MSIFRFLLIFWALLAGSAHADTLSGRVVGVADGDTITVLDAERQQYKVRLAQIDAPEKAQPFGQSSKEALSRLCYGKQAEIRPQTKDRYGRTVARVVCDGIDANAEQVRQGMAWVYDQYVTDRTLYAVQSEAKAAGRGLWIEAEPVQPWLWRKDKKSSRKGAAPESQPTRELIQAPASKCVTTREANGLRIECH